MDPQNIWIAQFLKISDWIWGMAGVGKKGKRFLAWITR